MIYLRPTDGLSLLAALALIHPLLQFDASAQSSRIEPASFPSTAQFRELQLRTLACGRDNDAENCTQARSMADPLLDNPLLPASCKDTLWNIRERAVVVSSNSYTRREALNREANDLTVLCRPSTRRLVSGSQEKQPEPRKPGGLGGLLRGLGGGGNQ